MAPITNVVEKECNPEVGEEILEELKQSILQDKNPIQRTLGMYELRNPSIGPKEKIENKGSYIKDLDCLLTYKARIVKDRVGIDFMTNQPKYKEREIFLE